MASEKETKRSHDIPLDAIQHYRGMAQEQSMNSLLSAQERYHTSKPDDSTRDCIYDAIEEAKRQTNEKDEVPVGGGQQEENSVKGGSEKQEKTEDSAGKGISGSSARNSVSGYVKNVKSAVDDSDVGANNDSK